MKINEIDNLLTRLGFEWGDGDDIYYYRYNIPKLDGLYAELGINNKTNKVSCIVISNWGDTKPFINSKESLKIINFVYKFLEMLKDYIND